MSEAAKSARGAFNEIKSGSDEMGGHIGGNMFASRHAIMAVTESLGVQMPRAITALITHIGPLGAALEAAFPFAAIGLAAVLLIEHLAKLKEEGIQLTEDQTKFGTAVQAAYNALDQRLLQAGIRADELRNDHLGALHLQLQLIDRQSMEELVHSFGEVAKAADVVFADLKTSWYQFGIGSAGAKHALEDFQTKYASLLEQGKDKEASDLLRGTRESAEKTLAMMKQATANTATQTGGNNTAAAELALEQARAELKKAGVGNTQKEVQAQEILVEALRKQMGMAERVNALKQADSDNARATTGKDGASRQAEAARQAAEHKQKMAELSLAIEREQAEASNSINEAAISERLMADMRLANEEYRIQLTGNHALADALDKGGKDYNNQLTAMHDKAEEITRQHVATVAGLLTKARMEQARQDLQDLEQSERAKIEATDQGSQARLAAIDAALKEEQAKGLQNTAFFRDLQNQRVQVQRQADEEAAKLAAEAGKEDADNVQKTGAIALAAQHEQEELANTLRRVSLQERMAQDIEFANAENALKMRAMEMEASALDKGAKDYENKLRAIQNKEKQLVQQHEDDVAAIKAKAQTKQSADERTAMASMEQNFASGFLQVLAGHQSFAAMMNRASEQLVGNLVSAGIAMANHLDDDRLKQAESAARWGFNWGAKYGGPAAPVLAPAMAATFFAGVMAFQEGGIVPGVGRGDIVPAMLEPGEGVIKNAALDKLNRGEMPGGGGATIHLHHAPVYDVQTIDGDGIRGTLTKHADEFARHVQGEIRKLNR